jgi:hypothetical protein
VITGEGTVATAEATTGPQEPESLSDKELIRETVDSYYAIETPEAGCAALSPRHHWQTQGTNDDQVAPGAFDGRGVQTRRSGFVPSCNRGGPTWLPRPKGRRAPQRSGQAWAELMKRLGCSRYVAQGGDWGAFVVDQMGLQAPAGLLAKCARPAVSTPIAGLAEGLLGPPPRGSRDLT